jgi:hypothetical protein
LIDADNRPCGLAADEALTGGEIEVADGSIHWCCGAGEP